MIINSQVINTIIPNGLKGEIFEQSGDYYTYCISTDKPRVFGEIMFKPNTCQIKFKMRVAAAFNKLPGFFRMSGYEQVARGGPAMLMTSLQMAHIVERVSNSYPELA